MRTLLFTLLLAASSPLAAQEVPEWFAETFLDFRDDVAEASKEGKRVMIYFWLRGCPSCKRLVEVTFRDPAVAARMRSRFVPIAVNVLGDREVTWIDGRPSSEKGLVAALGIQGTPTIVFLDEKGAAVQRLVGYVPPDRFAAALDAAAPRSRAVGK